MAEGFDPLVLREVIRQGERMLSIQMDTRESTLRRAGELLRLAVATLGGVILVGGILATKAFAVDRAALAVFGAAFAAVLGAAAQFSMVLAGTGRFPEFAYGPVLGRVVEEVEAGHATEAALLLSVARAMPEWIRSNEEVLARTQRLNGKGLVMLGLGSLVMLMTLLYILAGAIRG